MPFQTRVFKLAKDPERPSEDQDAYAADPGRGLAAVADGVSSALFSRQWAGIIAQTVVADPPDVADGEAFAAWLAERRQQWSEQIDTSGLAWFQKAKLPAGAFTTLLWVRISPAPQQEGKFGAYRLEGFAVGDSCLFHVRHGEVLRTFPIDDSEQLKDDPIVVGSVDLKRDHLVEFATLDELCYPDDLLVLCTDAVADWALRLMESGETPDFDRYWDMPQETWEAEIAALRDARQMRYDDTTLLLVRLVAEGVEIGQPQQSSFTAPAGSSGDEAPAEPEDWKEKLQNTGRQIADEIEKTSGRIWRGLKKWKDKAVDKYRQRSRPEDQ